MIPIRRKYSQESKSSVKKQRGRWPKLLAIGLFSICISVLSMAMSPSVAMATDYSLSIDDVTVGEGDGTATFTVTVSPGIVDNFDQVDVDWTTGDGTASAPGDYTADSGTLNFRKLSNPVTANITITINNDSTVEVPETFTITLSNATASVGDTVTISGDTGTGTINDNDYTLTIDKTGSAPDADCTVTASAGVPSGTGGGTTSSFPVSYVYEEGDTVTLTATEKAPVQGDPGSPGSIFLGWSGDLSGSNNPDSITMDSDKTVTASFNTSLVLTIIKAGSGAGVSTVTPAPGDHVYEEGTVVNLTATDTSPAAGSIFVDWECRTGDCPISVLTNPTDPVNATLTLNENTYVTATFLASYQITLTNPGTGSGTVRYGKAGVYVNEHLAPGEVFPIVVDDDPTWGPYRYFGLVSVDADCVFDGFSGDGTSVSMINPDRQWYLDPATDGKNVNATFTQTYEISIDDHFHR
jgi:hypothetical protein